jgi:hypothetical protein
MLPEAACWARCCGLSRVSPAGQASGRPRCAATRSTARRSGLAAAALTSSPRLPTSQTMVSGRSPPQNGSPDAATACSMALPSKLTAIRPPGALR